MTVSAGRAPRANIDPIRGAEDAMAVFSLAMSRPLQPETLVVLLNTDRSGRSLVVISGTTDPFQVVEIAETMAMSVAGTADIEGIVLATVRPGGGIEPGDDDLWLEAADVVEESGLVLIDWFVIGRRGSVSPREQLGMPSRWTPGW